MSSPRKAKIEAFTLVEVLLAAAIGAALITAAVLGFGLVSNLPMRQGALNVTLPPGVVMNFYGPNAALVASGETNTDFITMGSNPNYFQAAQARRMKDRLLEDVSTASAVFCLGRNSNGTPALRPHQLAVPDGNDFRLQGTPADFRDFLASAAGEAVANAFPAGQSGALLGYSNASIYIVGTLSSILSSNNTLTVLATYEIDFVPSVEPTNGTVASVRRYSGTNVSVPTDYYHLYYPGETNGADGFRPLGAFFGRRAADESGNNPFFVASNQPFTFVWWPDPLVSFLGAGGVPAVSAGSARENYTNMAGRTSLFFVLPTFPSL